MDGISQAKAGISAMWSTPLFSSVTQTESIFKFSCHGVCKAYGWEMMANFWDLLQQWQLAYYVTTFDCGSTQCDGHDTASLGRGCHTETRPRSSETTSSTSSPCKKDLFSLKKSSENKHSSQKNNCSFCIRCASKPSQDIYRFVQLFHGLKETCHISWVNGSHKKKEKLHRKAAEFKKGLTGCWIILLSWIKPSVTPVMHWTSMLFWVTQSKEIRKTDPYDLLSYRWP